MGWLPKLDAQTFYSTKPRRNAARDCKQLSNGRGAFALAGRRVSSRQCVLPASRIPPCLCAAGRGHDAHSADEASRHWRNAVAALGDMAVAVAAAQSARHAEKPDCSRRSGASGRRRAPAGISSDPQINFKEYMQKITVLHPKYDGISGSIRMEALFPSLEASAKNRERAPHPLSHFSFTASVVEVKIQARGVPSRCLLKIGALHR